MKRTITEVLAIILIVAFFALLEIMENTEISPAIQNIIAVISAFVIPFVYRFAFPLQAALLFHPLLSKAPL